MLDDFQYFRYCNYDHHLSSEAKSYIDRVRNSEPSRSVGVNAKNNLCTSRYSRKMGHTVSLESRGPENAFFVISDYDDRILEIWDQVEPRKVSRTNKKAKKSEGWHTPDALILSLEGPKVIEVKSEDEIEILIKTNPADWVIDRNGRVTYKPAGDAFSCIGLKHEVFVYKKSMLYKVANLELLMQSRNAQRYSTERRISATRAFEKQFYYSLCDLKSELNLDSYTELIQMVDDGILSVDLDNTLLSSSRGCVVTLEPVLLPEAMRLHHDRKVYEHGFLTEASLSRVPTQKYAERALQNLALVESGAKTRNVRRLKMKIRNGEKIGLTPFQSLIPDYFESGNRRQRLPKVVEDFLAKFLLDSYAPSQGLGVYRGHKQYLVAAKEEHPEHDPVCNKTFYNRLKRLPDELVARARGGVRAANAAMEPSDPEDRALKPQYAWQTAAADHYEADIFVAIFNSDDCVYAVRPYITALIDLYSKSVIGFSISLLPPSRRSISRVMRDCVRRHRRLPEEIIVDRGPDFKSVYFAALLADKQITLTLRPSAHPRYGSEVEGLFKDFMKIWLSQRQGNTTDYKEVRSVDRKRAPDRNAILRPYDLYQEFGRFVEWRDSKQRGMATESASAALHRSMREFPFIGKKVEIDTEFMIATSVDSKPYKVDFQRGLHIGDMYYWSPKLSSLRGKRKSVDTRPDAENPHVVYANVESGWVPCYSSHINAYSALDPISQHVAGLELVDAVNDKRAIREQADTELVHIIREMDNTATADNMVPIAEMALSDKGESSVFSQLRSSTVEPISTSFWEV